MNCKYKTSILKRCSKGQLKRVIKCKKKQLIVTTRNCRFCKEKTT
ncbi:MAG: hypothetical protein ACQERZ_04580 [Fusobacteriota bacterium]